MLGWRVFEKESDDIFVETHADHKPRVFILGACLFWGFLLDLKSKTIP